MQNDGGQHLLIQTCTTGHFSSSVSSEVTSRYRSFFTTSVIIHSWLTAHYFLISKYHVQFPSATSPLPTPRPSTVSWRKKKASLKLSLKKSDNSIDPNGALHLITITLVTKTPVFTLIWFTSVTVTPHCCAISINSIKSLCLIKRLSAGCRKHIVLGKGKLPHLFRKDGKEEIKSNQNSFINQRTEMLSDI